MDVTCLVGTYGGDEWVRLAQARAVPSAQAQAPTIHAHAETLAKARNAAAKQADSEWLCVVDADDEIAPGYFDAMAAATGDLRGPAVIYVKNGTPRPPKLWPVCDLRDGNFLVIGTLIRRDLFLEVGGFQEEELYEDWSLWSRAWKAGATAEQVPDAHYIAHVNGQSRNRTPDKATREYWHHQIRQSIWPEMYEVAA